MDRPTNALFEELDPEVGECLSRRETMAKIGKVGAAALAVASVPGMFAALSKSAFAQTGLPQQIIDALNFALTLEYLEAEFYAMGVAASGLIPSADRAVFQQISKHETAHVNLLKSVLGGSAVAKPTFDFTAGGMFDPFNPANYAQFLVLAQAFEDTGVRAYKGQAGELMGNNDVLTTALQIHSVEARHASEVRRIRGQKGWITLSSYDAGIPTLAGNPIYGGEQNLMQGDVDVTTITSIDANGVSEAFDEPLAKSDVLAVANLFIAG